MKYKSSAGVKPSRSVHRRTDVMRAVARRRGHVGRRRDPPGGARDKAQHGTLTTTSAKRQLTRISSKRRSVSRYIKKRDFRGFPLQDKFVQFPHSTPVASDHQDPSYRWYLGIPDPCSGRVRKAGILRYSLFPGTAYHSRELSTLA